MTATSSIYALPLPAFSGWLGAVVHRGGIVRVTSKHNRIFRPGCFPMID
jgi:hypothetical protein